MTCNPRNPEFGGDFVGRPADEEVYNFEVYPKSPEKTLPKENKASHTILAGALIYPERRGRGELREPVRAIRLSKKVKGLSGFLITNEADYWVFPRQQIETLSPGTVLGTYAENAKKIKK